MSSSFAVLSALESCGAVTVSGMQFVVAGLCERARTHGSRDHACNVAVRVCARNADGLRFAHFFNDQ